MTDSELKAFYTEAIDRPRFKRPYDGEDLKLWKRMIGWAEAADMRTALDSWWADHIEYPMPAELKPLLERARQGRMARSAVHKFLTRWKCPGCGIFACGYVTASEDLTRACRGIPRGRQGICGEIMSVCYTERAI